jgi:hypothetical protein
VINAPSFHFSSFATTADWRFMVTFNFVLATLLTVSMEEIEPCFIIALFHIIWITLSEHLICGSADLERYAAKITDGELTHGLAGLQFSISTKSRSFGRHSI